MTQIVTERADVVERVAETERVAESDVPAVGAAPADTSVIDSILEDELVEDVSIDGMCGVY